MLKNLNRLAPKIRPVLGKFRPAITKTTLSPEMRYRAKLEEAFQQVPYYRSQATTLAALLRPQVGLTSAAFATEFERLFPFAHPLSSESERYFRPERFAELGEVLVLTGSYNSAIPLFEINEQWEQPAQLENAGWRYVLPDPQIAPKLQPNPYQPDNFTRHWQQPAAQVNFALLGDCEQLEWALTEGLSADACQKLQQIFVRLTPTDDLQSLGRLQELAGSKSNLAKLDYLLFEPVLGYFGAFSTECQKFHLNSQRIWASPAQIIGGQPTQLLFSKLEQSRPFVLHYCPSDNKFNQLGQCALHNEAIVEQALAESLAENEFTVKLGKTC